MVSIHSNGMGYRNRNNFLPISGEKRKVYGKDEDLVCSGGTAGHINPALAIAGTVREKEPDAEILYVGAKGGMEEKLVPPQDMRLKV